MGLGFGRLAIKGIHVDFLGGGASEEYLELCGLDHVRMTAQINAPTPEIFMSGECKFRGTSLQ